jgi:hypothetical protein
MTSALLSYRDNIQSLEQDKQLQEKKNSLAQQHSLTHTLNNSINLQVNQINSLIHRNLISPNSSQDNLTRGFSAPIENEHKNNLNQLSSPNQKQHKFIM